MRRAEVSIRGSWVLPLSIALLAVALAAPAMAESHRVSTDGLPGPAPLRTLPISALLDLGLQPSDTIMQRRVARELRRRATSEQEADRILDHLLPRAGEEGALPLLWSIHDRCPLTARARILQQLVPLQLNRSVSLENRRTGVLICSRIATQSPPAERRRQAARLRSILQDDAEPALLRADAIRGLVWLTPETSLPALLRIVEEASRRTGRGHPDLTRSACAGLARLAAPEAAPILGRLLAATDEPELTTAAAIALGRIGNEEALRLLIEHRERLGDGVITAALVQMDELVLELLARPDATSLPAAIRATEFLYREQQIAQYRPALMRLLSDGGQDDANIRLILERFAPLATRVEAAEIMRLVPRQPAYAPAWERLRGRSRITLRPGQPSRVPTGEMKIGQDSRRENLETFEYADPGYRHNAFTWAGLGWLGHSGLFAGIDGSEGLRVIEVDALPLGSPIVKNTDAALMLEDPDYWGAFTLDLGAGYMTFERRRNVMNTAIELMGYDIQYPLLSSLDTLIHGPEPGVVVEPWEITHLRCDGLIEYCYEWHGYPVWGQNANPAYYDLSVTDNVDRHNDFYDDPYDPDTELAPVVQAGLEGGTSTNMTLPAVTDVPTYVVGHAVDGNQVTLLITATDPSGIHYIRYKIGESGTWVTSPVQSQHPVSASYAFADQFELTQPSWIYFFAMDNAQNYPELAESYHVNLEGAPTSAVTLPMHAEVTFSGNCGIQDPCAPGPPTTEIPPATTIAAYLLARHQDGLVGVQTAFDWPTGWALLSSSWNCQTNQIASLQPVSPGSTTGTLATVFDCVTGGGSAVIGYLQFAVLGSGCLTQLDSSFPGGTHVIDCTATAIPVQYGNRGSICVGEAGINACDPIPAAVELAEVSVTSAGGQVRIAWRTARERDHLGFHLHRARGEHRVDSRQYDPITDDLIRPDGGRQGKYVFVDADVEPGARYAYRLEAIDLAGGSEFFKLPAVTVDAAPPLRLVGGWPNPFRGRTSIIFDLPARERVVLRIYDAQGRAIRTLVDRELAAGRHAFDWDGLDREARPVGSGIYFCRLEAGARTPTRKLIRLR